MYSPADAGLNVTNSNPGRMNAQANGSQGSKQKEKDSGASPGRQLDVAYALPCHFSSCAPR